MGVGSGGFAAGIAATAMGWLLRLPIIFRTIFRIIDMEKTLRLERTEGPKEQHVRRAA